jgi:hypothetical protein
LVSSPSKSGGEPNTPSCLPPGRLADSALRFASAALVVLSLGLGVPFGSSASSCFGGGVSYHITSSFNLPEFH